MGRAWGAGRSLILGKGPSPPGPRKRAPQSPPLRDLAALRRGPCSHQAFLGAGSPPVLRLGVDLRRMAHFLGPWTPGAVVVQPLPSVKDLQHPPSKSGRIFLFATSSLHGSCLLTLLTNTELRGTLPFPSSHLHSIRKRCDYLFTLSSLLGEKMFLRSWAYFCYLYKHSQEERFSMS